jgi:hypothetical protein
MDARFGGQPHLHLGGLVSGVVIADQVQFLVGVGGSHLLEESQVLGAAVSGLAGGGDRSGGDLQRREQGRGSVSHVVVGAFLD